MAVQTVGMKVDKWVDVMDYCLVDWKDVILVELWGLLKVGAMVRQWVEELDDLEVV